MIQILILKKRCNLFTLKWKFSKLSRPARWMVLYIISLINRIIFSSYFIFEHEMYMYIIIVYYISKNHNVKSLIWEFEYWSSPTHIHCHISCLGWWHISRFRVKFLLFLLSLPLFQQKNNLNLRQLQEKYVFWKTC